MPQLAIFGGTPLSGTVRVNGAKNAALPIMAASLLTDGVSLVRSAPDVRDVRTLSAILRALGMKCEREGDVTELAVLDDSPVECPEQLGLAMRASVCLLGPLLARRGRAEVPMPGGCDLGDRPIDLHLKGLTALGAEFSTRNGMVIATARDGLTGARMRLGGPNGSTVLGTANVMMAATLAQGTTVIEHAACEPEIADLADYLNACGAQVSGAGTNAVTIEGVEKLHGAPHTVIPDRIEAGTYAAAAAATDGDVVLENVRPDHMQTTIEFIESMGIRCDVIGDSMRVHRAERVLRPGKFTTAPYPGIPTDMQPQLMSLLCMAEGTGSVTEGVYPERFKHVAELKRLGAHILRNGPQAFVNGPCELSGATVHASNLRAGAGLIVAALAADGVTTLTGLEQVDRGYEGIEVRLAALGANVTRVSDETARREAV